MSYPSALPVGKNSRGPFWKVSDLFGKFRTILESPLKPERAQSAARTGIATEHAAEGAGEMVGMTEAESLVNLLNQISIVQE